MPLTLRTNAPTLGLLVALALVFCLITRDAARAANVSWVSPGSGVWSDGGSWSGGVVPGAGDYVSILNAVGQYAYVTQNLPDVTISQLTMATYKQVTVPAGNTLRLANPGVGVRALSGGILSLSGGTLRIATDGAMLSNNSQIQMINGSILGNGVLDNGHSIYGSGIIGNSGSNGSHDLRILNVGNSTNRWIAIRATSNTSPLLVGPTASATSSNPGITNRYASLAAENGTLILRGPSIVSNVEGGDITASNGGIVKLTNGIDVRFEALSDVGSFKGTGKIQIPLGESATVQNATSSVANFESLGSLTLGGGFTNNAGSVFSIGGSVSRIASSSAYYFTNKGTLRGLNESALMDLGNWTVANSNAATIEGAGTIKAYQISAFGGVIRSNIAVQTLTLLSSALIGPSGANLLATNGSTLMIGTLTPTPNYVGSLNGITATVDPGSAMFLNTPAYFSGSITNNGSLTFNSTTGVLSSITGSGTVRFSNVGSRSVVTLRQAKLELNDVTLSDPTGADIWRTGDLSFGGTAKIALRDNPFILDHDTNSPIDSIQTRMADGRFISLVTGEVVGYVEASDIGAPTTFMGEGNIDPTTLLLRSTFTGDTNLDHDVDFDDLLTLAQHYGSTAAYWNDGDFDHDRVVGFDDLLLLAQRYVARALEDVPSGNAAFDADWKLARSFVPEPTMLALPLLLMARLRRR